MSSSQRTQNKKNTTKKQHQYRSNIKVKKRRNDKHKFQAQNTITIKNRTLKLIKSKEEKRMKINKYIFFFYKVVDI